jgi:quercetin dioxygenase-like cupin family protein
MLTPVRRIVTHNDSDGTSYALMDGIATHTFGTLTELWTTGPLPHDHASADDAGHASDSLEPPRHGTVFRYFEIPPQAESAHLSVEERTRAWTDLFASMKASHIQVDTSRDPGMHKSATTDYIILLRGQITLVLEKSEHDLKPFDVVVQRGTNHAWVNRGSENALLMAVLVDARA